VRIVAKWETLQLTPVEAKPVQSLLCMVGRGNCDRNKGCGFESRRFALGQWRKRNLDSRETHGTTWVGWTGLRSGGCPK